MGKKHLRPERKQTDDSLAVERANADVALAETATAIEKKADVVLEQAREEADEVLIAARAKADEKLKQPLSTEQSQVAVAKERATEDQVLRDERTEADANLRRERAANARVLARLLPLERDKTDLFLLTERARSDDALAHRDDFLGMVSHDLRDLLNVVVMSAATIGDGADHVASSLIAAQRIQRAAGRMNRLIGDLIDIASIDAGKLAITTSVVDVAATVLEAVETWGPPALTKGIVLESVAAGPVRANVDHARILQILGNLITNAVKFSTRGGKLVIGVEEVAGEARFFVRDTGIGIASDKLEPIFERFWQVGANDRRGLGLGLYISRCLVEAHGGKIWAESEVGTGSTFFFTVPTVPSSAPDQGDHHDQAQRRGG